MGRRAARLPGLGRRPGTTTRAWSSRWSADFGYVDILVNNAGIASRGQTVADTDPAELERVVRTHAIGPHFLMQAGAAVDAGAAPRRHRDDLERGHARTTAAGGAPYNMGKAALEALAFTAGQGGAAPRHPRQRGGARAGGDRDGPPPGPGRGRRAGRHASSTPRARSAGSASPRTWPTSCASWCPTPPATSPASASPSTAAASGRRGPLARRRPRRSALRSST